MTWTILDFQYCQSKFKSSGTAQTDATLFEDLACREYLTLDNGVVFQQGHAERRRETGGGCGESEQGSPSLNERVLSKVRAELSGAAGLGGLSSEFQKLRVPLRPS